MWLLISRNSVVFRQTRPGLRGVPFTCYKFTSMQDMGSEGTTYDANWRHGQKRIPPFGALIRSLGLDELPQLLNVIRGDMSLIGPRPLLMDHLKQFNTRDHHRHDVRPGITGLAQVKGRNDLSWAGRFRYDIFYVDHLSFGLDAWIMFRTFVVVLTRAGFRVAGDKRGYLKQ